MKREINKILRQTNYNSHQLAKIVIETISSNLSYDNDHLRDYKKIALKYDISENELVILNEYLINNVYKLFEFGDNFFHEGAHSFFKENTFQLEID